MFEQAFRNIDDALRKEAGCTTELDYTEQTSSLLFLESLDGLEEDKAAEAALHGKKYDYILAKPYRRDTWAAPKKADGSIDDKKAMGSDDLTDFVDDSLFPYLQKFKQSATSANTIEAGLLGSPILVPESGRFLHNQRLGHVEGKPGVPWSNEFFFHVFNLKHLRDELHHTGTGLKVRHTSPTKIGNVVVSFHNSMTEQKKIVARLAEVDAEAKRLDSLYQQKLAALEVLKKSLLHQAFNGEI